MKFTDKTIGIITELHLSGLSYSSIAEYLIDESLDSRSHRTLRRAVAEAVLSIKPEKDVTAKTSLEEFCAERKIPIDQVKSAKYISNNNQDTWNIQLITKEDEVIGEDIVEQLKETFSKMIPLAVQETETNDKGLFIYSSDKHVGADSDGAIFGNKYDDEVFQERMYDITKRMYNEKQIHGKFDTLLLGDLGDGLDGLDGKTTRGGHTLPQNLSNEDAFDVYVAGQKKLVDDAVLMDIANHYIYWAVVSDNHSGIFAYTAHRTIEEYIKAKYPFIKVHIQKTFIEHFSYGVHTFMMSHGKDDKYRKFGLPLNPDKKSDDLINNYIKYNRLKGTLHFIKGDLHQSSTNMSNDKGFRYRNVPSLYGGSGYVQTNYGLCTPSTGYEIVYKNVNRITQDEIIHS